MRAGDDAGLDLHLDEGSDDLQGWIRGFADVVRPPAAQPRAEAVARRVSCPDELGSHPQ